MSALRIGRIRTLAAALPTINETVTVGSTFYADEASHWDTLHAASLRISRN
jgi:hypothetical protein